ncbi:MAG: hypothetical protein CMJ78_19640 [Planctomycetaceae bacterium]|nr:hypothetical protein [Planctomycetaceae bacterium]
MSILAVSIVLGCSGCADTESSITTDMDADFTHQHKHQHDDQSAHEHHHKSFSGHHKHAHDHGHRHGKPPHDGKIVSIGHSKQATKSPAFHAEILPILDNKVRFHLLIEESDGKFNNFSIDSPRLAAELGVEKNSSPTRLFFTTIDETQQGSLFELDIPSSMKDVDTLFVKLPEVKLGDDMHSFEFTILRAQESTRGN